MIRQNAHQGSKELALKLHVSSATVRRRLKNLLQNKEVSIVAIASPMMRGVGVSAVIAIEADYAKLDDLINRLANREEVIWLSSTTGRFTIVALLEVASTDAIHEFINTELTNAEGVKTSETFICLRVRKSLYSPD